MSEYGISNLKERSGYVGRMKQPIAHPRIDKPSMFFITDFLKQELDLLLLTPGTWLAAHEFIKQISPISIKIFVPTLRPEFLSDVYNLYFLERKERVVNWVFPIKMIQHVSFLEGQIAADHWVNPSDPKLSITYFENTNLENVFDMIVRTRDGSNYFSFFLTENRLKNLYKSKDCTWINIPKSSTIYGGLSYDDSIKIEPKYRKKLVPYDFVSLEEFYQAKGVRYVPPFYRQWNIEEENEENTGDVTEEEIFRMLDDATGEGETNDFIQKS